jgi:hypothetical protein
MKHGEGEMRRKVFPDLAGRRQKVRGAAVTPIALTVQLQTQVYRSLAETAAEQGMSVEDFAAWIINQHTEMIMNQPEEVQ